MQGSNQTVPGCGVVGYGQGTFIHPGGCSLPQGFASDLLGLPSCLPHLPPTLVPDPRVTGLLGLVSTAEEGTEEDEKMQAEKDGGKGKSGPLVCMGDQAVEQ